MIDSIKNIMKLMQNDDKDIRYVEIGKNYSKVFVNYGIECISNELNEKIIFEQCYEGLGGWYKCIYVDVGRECFVKFLQYSTKGKDE